MFSLSFPLSGITICKDTEKEREREHFFLTVLQSHLPPCTSGPVLSVGNTLPPGVNMAPTFTSFRVLL